MHHTTIIQWSQLDGSMHRRCRGTTHHDWCCQPFFLKQLAQQFHLLQRRGNESADAHHARLPLLSLF